MAIHTASAARIWAFERKMRERWEDVRPWEGAEVMKEKSSMANASHGYVTPISSEVVTFIWVWWALKINLKFISKNSQDREFLMAQSVLVSPCKWHAEMMYYAWRRTDRPTGCLWEEFKYKFLAQNGKYSEPRLTPRLNIHLSQHPNVYVDIFPHVGQTVSKRRLCINARCRSNTVPSNMHTRAKWQNAIKAHVGCLVKPRDDSKGPLPPHISLRHARCDPGTSLSYYPRLAFRSGCLPACLVDNACARSN